MTQEVHVYTDGACQGNHLRKGAIGGVGVWFGKNDPRNLSERLAGDVQTNNRAELTALIKAIEIYYADGDTNGDANSETKDESPDETSNTSAKKQKLDKSTYVLVLHTDSQYCKNGIESWIKGWKKNGWKTANKKPVKNQDLWMRLDELQQAKSVRFEWVAGHAGIEGNEEADRLATAGCSK